MKTKGQVVLVKFHSFPVCQRSETSQVGSLRGGRSGSECGWRLASVPMEWLVGTGRNCSAIRQDVDCNLDYATFVQVSDERGENSDLVVSLKGEAVSCREPYEQY